ncbi:MAG: bifunctional phosphopantothenoylcysteine decarboxylase/phosphopantothenate--cysteine ligase CoaBC [Thermoplasmata archaeon]|nr:MAG: bifunctional phosphopantothenoylcysteine decarboxylase/phosphopantothenate--cysteine ligase CoaBC [Thermoplasmata archaeon]
MMHPSKALHESKSTKLSGKKIILGVTGSIAAVESVKLARELLRHGAEVIPVMTPSACRIIHPDAMEFATSVKPIVELTGAVEHVSYCGEVPDRADLLLIAPATANTISKIAQGIDDTTVTTFATTALGTGIPIQIVPAMHGSMYNNPLVRKNLKVLEEQRDAVEIIGPRMEEHKAKIAETEEIVARVIRRLWKGDLAEKRVLVVAGSTAEPVDEFRTITNKSTGKMGIELAQSAFMRGAEVTLWYGQSPSQPPTYIYTERFQSVNDLLNKLSFIDFDVTIVCAAISDYTPERQEGKIPSGQDVLTLNLKPTPKVLAAIREADQRTFLVGFKAEYDVSEQQLIKKAAGRQEQYNLDMMVANDLKDVSEDRNYIYILHKDGKKREAEGKKAELAEIIFDEIEKKILNSKS